MPDTAIARVNKLASNEPYRFIFKDCICRPIGYIGITGVHRNADYSNKNQAHKTLLTSSSQQKRQRRSQSYQIPTLTLTSTTRHPQNRYRYPSNHLKIPLQSQSNHQQLLRRKIDLISPAQECVDMTE